MHAATCTRDTNSQQMHGCGDVGNNNILHTSETRHYMYCIAGIFHGVKFRGFCGLEANHEILPEKFQSQCPG